MTDKKITVSDVNDFWNNHPLGSYEVGFDQDNSEFYSYLDAKKKVASQFSQKLQKYPENKGKKVLELGCGPGWNVKNFALSGAHISACDITKKGASLAKGWLKKLNVPGNIAVGNVEAAPFKSNYFDFVLCDGVLHHTPGIDKGLKEFYRIMKPGATGLASVYYKNILLRSFIFPITKLVLWILNVKFLGGKRVDISMSLDEFGRLYDGTDNVLGKIYSKKEIFDLVKNAGLIIDNVELHYFPTPFIPGGRFIPNPLKYMFGRLFGTMIYIQVHKKVS